MAQIPPSTTKKVMIMKTLVNKANPAIRITATEIEENEYQYTVNVGKLQPLIFLRPEWALVEEEPPQLQELEQAAGDYIVQLNEEDLEGGFNAAFNAFKAGAEWMKEQDELTWQDVKAIVNIADMLIVSNEPSKFPTEQRFYEEVLNVFNEQKNKEI